MKTFVNSETLSVGFNINQSEHRINRLTVLLLTVAIILGAIGIFRGWLLNPIGDFLGYGRCPNCGDSWLWKSDGIIPIGPPVKDISSQHQSSSVLCIEIQHGIMICRECLARPADLNEVRIERDLLSYPEGGWSPEEAVQVREAVAFYKKEKLRF